MAVLNAKGSLVAGILAGVGKKTATVKLDPDRANVAALVRATTNAGFLHGAQLKRR